MKKKRKLIHRIGALVCALVVTISCMGSVPYYASDFYVGYGYEFLKNNLDKFVNTDIEETVPDFIELVSSYKYYVILYSSSSFNLILSNEEIYLELVEYPQGSIGSLEAFVCEYYICTSDDNAVFYTTNGESWGNPCSFNEFAYCFKFAWAYESDKISSQNYSKFYMANSKICCGDVVLLHGGESYNSSLGYLQNVRFESLYLEDNAFTLVEDTMKWQYTFDNVTTTGVSIDSEEYYIRHFMEIEIKDKNYNTEQVYDKVLVGEYSAQSCKVSALYKDIISKVHELSGFEGLNFIDNAFGKGVYYHDYLQIVRVDSSGSVEYGGYVKITRDEHNIHVSNTLDENMNVDNGGYVDKVVDTSHGSGSTYEEAEHESNKNYESSKGEVDELSGTINDFTSTLGEVPQAIGVIFAFLPPWCLGLLGITFGLLCVLIVVKTIRG